MRSSAQNRSCAAMSSRDAPSRKYFRSRVSSSASGAGGAPCAHGRASQEQRHNRGQELSPHSALHGRLRALSLQPVFSLNRRTLLLLALLPAVAGSAAWTRMGAESHPPAAQHAETAIPRHSTESTHPRIDDAASMLAPLARGLDGWRTTFTTDLGIDVHVVTLTEPGSIGNAVRTHLPRAQDRGDGADRRPARTAEPVDTPGAHRGRLFARGRPHGPAHVAHRARPTRALCFPTQAPAWRSWTSCITCATRFICPRRSAISSLARSSARTAFAKYERFVSGGAGAKTALSAVPMDADLKAPVPPERRALRALRRHQGIGRQRLFRCANADLVGDPKLPLLHRRLAAHARAIPVRTIPELERLERIDASLPLVYHVDGDYAVATSERPVRDSCRSSCTASRASGGWITSRPGRTSSSTTTASTSFVQFQYALSFRPRAIRRAAITTSRPCPRRALDRPGTRGPQGARGCLVDAATC